MKGILPFQTGISLLTIVMCLSALFVGTASISQVDTARAGNPTKKLLKLHNRERKKKNRPKLRLDSSLKRSAQGYAQAMAVSGVLSHVGTDGSTFDQRIRAKGGSFSYMGENIAQGPSTATIVHKGWMGSPSHKKNILNRRFRTVGFGKAGNANFWAVNFGD